MVIVQHLEPHRVSALTEVLGKHATIHIAQASTGMKLERGHAYLAPPDHHLTVTAKRVIRLTSTPRVHFVRPSADVLFESVANVFGLHAIGVVLSGTGFDGSTGAAAIKKAGGAVVVQDEATSQHFGMPGNVVRAGNADAVLPLENISAHLMGLMAE
jgi:two-component system, chemotaxis family, protein-glutamate methylesterase/glutaminase